MSSSVCMFICLSACISQKPHDQTSPNFCACCLWLWLSLFFCDTLCIFDVMDNVIFSQNGLYGASYVFQNGENVTTITTTLVPTNFCSTTKISKYTSLVMHRGWNILSVIAFFVFVCLLTLRRKKVVSGWIHMPNYCVENTRACELKYASAVLRWQREYLSTFYNQPTAYNYLNVG